MTDRMNLIETIAKQEKFSTFMRLMGLSGMNELIKASGPFTVFVPTNEAFSKIPESKINELLNETGQARLKAMLSYHILPGKVMAASLVSAPSRKAFSGEELMFTDVNGLKVNGASVQARNLEATNGVLHSLDTLLIPTRVAATTTGQLATAIAARRLAAAAKAAASTIPAEAPAVAGVSASSAVPANASLATAGAETKPIL